MSKSAPTPQHLLQAAIYSCILLVFLFCTLAKVTCAAYFVNHSSNDPTQPLKQPSRNNILDDLTF